MTPPFASLPVTPSPPGPRPGRRPNVAPAPGGVRATAEIAADVLVAHMSTAARREAADRLTELDAEIARLRAQLDAVVEHSIVVANSKVFVR